MPVAHIQPSLFTWGILTLFFLLSIVLGFFGGIAKKKNTSQIIPKIYWFLAFHTLNFFVALCFFYFLPELCQFLPFALALIYFLVGLIFGLPLLWTVGASTLAVWYAVQTTCFVSAPFYLPESPIFYGILGIVFCLLPFSTVFHERVNVTAKVEIVLGGVYVIIGLLLFFHSYSDLVPQEIVSTLLFALPVVLFIMGIDALKKQPDSLKGEWILFFAFHAFILCLMGKLLPYPTDIFPFAEYLIPVGIACFFLILAFVFTSLSWWIMALSIPGLWIPFLIVHLCKRPFFSWEVVILLLVLGGLVLSSYFFFRQRRFIQETKQEGVMIAVIYFVVAALLCLKLLAGLPEVAYDNTSLSSARQAIEKNSVF